MEKLKQGRRAPRPAAPRPRWKGPMPRGLRRGISRSDAANYSNRGVLVRAANSLARSAQPIRTAIGAARECRGGETADAVDSKSTVGNHMRVQVPPSAPTRLSRQSSDLGSVA